MPPATLGEITAFIQGVGFPIFVALLLLYRVDNMHKENLVAIHALTDAVWALTGKRPGSSNQ